MSGSRQRSAIQRVPAAVRFGVLAVLASLGVLLLWLVLRGPLALAARGSSSDPVAEAVRGWIARPIEGRLSGGFEYAPFDPEAAAKGASLQSVQGKRLLRLGVDTLRGSATVSGVQRDVPASWILGRLSLLRGDAAEAVDILDEARRTGRPSPGMLSDLAAAFLARGAAGGDPGDLARALDVSERALELDRDSPEALFNRALALEGLYLTDAATIAWERYLEVDRDSRWATEASLHLVDLHAAASSAAPQERGGFPATAPTDPREARGRELLEAGVTLYEEYRLSEATERLSSARSGLAALGSPLTPWADYYLALCRYQESDYDGALGRLARVVEATNGEGEEAAAVLGRSLQLAGLIHSIEGRYGEGLAAYQEAARVLGGGASHRAWVGVESSLAESYERLGDRRSAWRHRYVSLAESSSLDARGRVRLYAEPTSAVLRAGLPRAARFFADSMVRAAEEAASPSFSVAAYRRRAEVWAGLGEVDLALADLDRALGASEEIGSQSVSSITRADILLTRSDLEVDGSSADALADGDEALAIYRETDNLSGQPRALRARARAHRKLGDLDRAQGDVERAVSLLEEGHRAVGGLELRGTFFGKARPVFVEMISLALERDDLPGALAAAERAHRVAAIDLWGDRPGATVSNGFVSLEGVRARLAPGSALLEYFVLPDRLLVGLIRSEGAWVRQVTVGAPELDGLVRELRRRLERGESRPAVRQAAARLYERLIEPVRDLLQAGDDLVVIPDGSLHAVPFAVLWDVEAGRHLIEDHQVLVSPSAAFAVSGLGRRASSPTTPRILVVADPDPDPALDDLGELRGARQEAGAVGALFPEVTVITGAEATAGRILEAAPGYEVVHYGGHAITNPANPLLSYLALAPEDGPGTGMLFARDLATLRLRGTELVVLAACRSADQEGPVGFAGLSSLSRAFLAAGVPTVIGSLWDARDRSTARLFELFYRELQRGVPPPAALRSAQLEMSSEGDGNTPFTFAWAAFRVEGSIVY